jgi:hypothetical protein
VRYNVFKRKVHLVARSRRRAGELLAESEEEMSEV